MLKIGLILFAIGAFLLLPFEEVFILIPLIAWYGIEVVPIYYAVCLSIFIIGALLIGVHIMPWMIKHPIALGVLIVSLAIALYVWVL